MISLVVIGHDVPKWEDTIIPMTMRCLETMHETLQGVDHEVLFIDNGSNDNHQMGDKVIEYFGKINKEGDPVLGYIDGPKVDGPPPSIVRPKYSAPFQGSFIRTDKNEPISKCWNYAVGWAKGDAVFLVNNDIIFHKPGWAQQIIQSLNSPSCGAVGGQLMSWNNFNFLEGSLLAFRKDVALSIAENGMVFDEQFTFTCEEVDFCHRLEMTGLALFMQSLEINGYYTHLKHGTLSYMFAENVDMLGVMHENRIRLCRKYGLPERVND